MSFTTLKARWAAKLLKAKYFIVMTDTESAIAFEGVNPASMDDQIALAAQRAELAHFHSELGNLIRQHDRALKDLESANAVQKTKKKNANKKVTKRA